MMDTILNLGLNDEAVEGLARTTGNRAFRLRRLPAADPDVRRRRRRSRRAPLRGRACGGARGRRRGAGRRPRRRAISTELVGRFKQIYRAGRGRRLSAGRARPARRAIRARLRLVGLRRGRRSTGGRTTSRTTSAPRSTSCRWCSETRAKTPAPASRFTRDPATGEQELYGEFLANAQGEDVVAGIRTPQPLEAHASDSCPDVYERAARRRCASSRSTTATCRTSSSRSRTAGSSSCRRARRSAHATVGAEGRPSTWSTRGSITQRGGGRAASIPPQLDQLLHPMIDPKADYEVVATRSQRVSPGAATGGDRLRRRHGRGARPAPESPVILVRLGDDARRHPRHDRSAKGSSTVHGGMTSHAAVVARGMGKPCVAGLRRALDRPRASEGAARGATSSHEGDVITIDGGTGAVYPRRGRPRAAADQRGLRDSCSTGPTTSVGCKVRANADTPADAAKAREFGAQGIGLCRTEHMFIDRRPASASSGR